MQHIQIGSAAYEVLKDFLENERQLDMTTWRFRSDTFRKYYQTMDRIIEEGIKAIKEFEEFDRHVTRIEEAKVRIEEAKKRMEVDE